MLLSSCAASKKTSTPQILPKPVVSNRTQELDNNIKDIEKSLKLVSDDVDKLQQLLQDSPKANK